MLTQICCAVQVLFHLQTRSPPVLPPLCELFKQDADTLQARPLHAGQQPEEGVIEVSSVASHIIWCDLSRWVFGQKAHQESSPCALCIFSAAKCSPFCLIGLPRAKVCFTWLDLS